MLLKSEEEIFNRISQERLISPDAMNPNLYRMYYDCPCGGQHPLPTCNHILCAFPIKFFINCENNIVTLVRIKGAIKQTVVEEWSCQLDSFLSVIEAVLGDEKNLENNKREKTESEKSYEKNKENKSSKEKTEKKYRSDFYSKNNKSSSEKNTESSFSIDFSLLGKNKEELLLVKTSRFVEKDFL